MNPSAILADHIDDRTEAIVAMWQETILRDEAVPDADGLSYHELRDHIPEVLDRLAQRLRGWPEEAGPEGRAHGRLRFRQGYDIAEVVRELGHLRRALIRTCCDYARENGFADRLTPVLEAIDEVIDGAVAEAVAQFQREALTASEAARRDSTASLAALRAERLTLRAVLENLPVGVWVVNASGTIVAVNPEAERLQGVPGSEVIGRVNLLNDVARYNVLRLDGTPYQPAEMPIARALRGETVRQEEILWPLEGVPRNFSVNASALRDSAGTIVGAVAIREEITERKRVEERLRQESSFIGAVTESMAEGLYAIDPVGRLTFINPAACRLLGWSADELVGSGRHSHEAFHHTRPDGSPYPLEECPLWEAQRTGRVLRGEETFVRRDGTFLPVTFCISPLIQDGAPVGTVLTFDDLTTRRRLEANLAEAEARYRSIVEHSPVMIWRAGPDGVRDYFNGAWLEFRGHDAEQETGGDWAGGIHPDDRDACEETYRQAVGRREPFRVIYRMSRHDGQYRSLLEHGTPYHDAQGRLLGYLGSCVDITERVELEAALREQRALAEDASLRKSRLLSALSHDARTPLNAVALASQLLELHFREGADPEVLDCLRMIRHSVDNVQDLLGDLLNLSRIDAGAVSVQLETFTLERALAECLSGIEPQARLKGLACRLEPGPLAGVEVHTDRSKLKQIVSNLLSNALRFTTQGHVRLFATTEAGQVSIGVEDTGSGIDPADHARIFEEFARLDGPHRPTGEGTGLGLAICRRLANLLGGEITVESTVGRGSTFRLVLPGSILTSSVANDGEPRADADPVVPDVTHSPAPGAGGAILIAEDHLASRQALARVLRRLGYTALEASNGRDAIILARRERPLAVLMDVAMPVMDGIEATALLRSDRATQDVPIFALTGDVTLVTRERIGQAGISGFLEKPVTPEALRRALATLRPAGE